MTSSTLVTGSTIDEQTRALGLHVRVSMRLGGALVVVWALVFAAASGARFSLGWSALPLLLFETFYRIGSTIFGGGQVVLPMLLTQVVGPGWVSETAFYAGMALTHTVVEAISLEITDFERALTVVQRRPVAPAGGAADAGLERLEAQLTHRQKRVLKELLETYATQGKYLGKI